MNSQAFAVPRAARAPWDRYARRALFVALLAAVPWLPHVSSNGFIYPAVTSFWVLLPFCALFLLPLLDVRAPWRGSSVDLLVLLSLIVPLGGFRPWRTWPVVVIYLPLLYLAIRMIVIARIGRTRVVEPPVATSPPALPRRWLVVGIALLAAVHVSWALDGSAITDVGQAGVQGALQIIHGRPLYGAPPASLGADPHLDSYGPFNYEAYLPFASIAAPHAAARLAAMFFDLLTALLLFIFGRRVRGPDAGIVLAYAWLAFPLTLYEGALAFNDAIVACMLIAVILVARSPARRGAMAAACCWTKLSPLALVPLLLSEPAGDGHRSWRAWLRFGIAFAAASAIIFVPALAHGSLSTFVTRTFGFQASRTPTLSIWDELQTVYVAHGAWIGVASRVVHGLLLAVTGAFAIMLVRLPRRTDAVGLAAACAAVLIALQICLDYYSFSYVLWFAPLVMLAVILPRVPAAPAVASP